MKNIKYLKSIIAILLFIGISFSTFAAIVSDNDGAAFVNKKDFEDLKKNFESQITNYSDSIDRKIDGAIASYLSGVKVAAKTELKSLLNKVNDDCNDSYMDGTTETKYNYRCMAKSYNIPTTQKPKGAIVNLFYAITKCYTPFQDVNWYNAMWHRMAMTMPTRTGLFDVDVPDTGRENGKYIMLDVYKGKDEDKYYATNRYNNITYRYYTTGSGVAQDGTGWPDFDATDWSVVWSFPTFNITETEYWKIEIDRASAYWNNVGGLSAYDDVMVMYGPSYDTSESINVIPIAGSISATVYGLDKNKITKMTLQDTSYDWEGYGDSVVSRGTALDDNVNKKQLWYRESPRPTITFNFNCHPYDANVKLQDLIDYNATVAYADEDGKTVAIYGGLPVFRTPSNGEVTMKIKFKSDLNHDVYVGLQKKQFENDGTYAIDSDLNLRNENDVKYTSNKFERDKEYTFKMDVMKDDVIWIKTYDASSDTGFTGAETTSIMLVEE